MLGNTHPLFEMEVHKKIVDLLSDLTNSDRAVYAITDLCLGLVEDLIDGKKNRALRMNTITSILQLVNSRCHEHIKNEYK